MRTQQTVPITPWGKNKKIILWIVVSAVLVVTIFTAFIAAAYTFHWTGTGFTSSKKTTTTTEVTQPLNKKVTTTIEDQPAKTLWDWLPLLIQLLGALAIPIVVGFGTAFFTRQQAKTSEANAESQQQEELLRTYFDKLSDLLLNKAQSTNPNIQAIVRARTLAALHILNAERKTIVLRFLHDSTLLQHVKSFLYSLDLSHTDLNRIDLRDANLSNSKLSSSNLVYADLRGADLRDANLRDANLRDADLSHANFSGANFSGAILVYANLSGANLIGADLRGAILSSADLTGAILSSADLTGASLIFTDLTGANLHLADLSTARLDCANLSRADLTGATLRGADLRDVNLHLADLSGAIATPEQFTGVKFITPGQLAKIKSS